MCPSHSSRKMNHDAIYRPGSGARGRPPGPNGLLASPSRFGRFRGNSRHQANTTKVAGLRPVATANNTNGLGDRRLAKSSRKMRLGSLWEDCNRFGKKSPRDAPPAPNTDGPYAA
jgi:hypothetical protein